MCVTFSVQQHARQIVLATSGSALECNSNSLPLCPPSPSPSILVPGRRTCWRCHGHSAALWWSLWWCHPGRRHTLWWCHPGRRHTLWRCHPRRPTLTVPLCWWRHWSTPPAAAAAATRRGSIHMIRPAAAHTMLRRSSPPSTTAMPAMPAVTSRWSTRRTHWLTHPPHPPTLRRSEHSWGCTSSVHHSWWWRQHPRRWPPKSTGRRRQHPHITRWRRCSKSVFNPILLAKLFVVDPHAILVLLTIVVRLSHRRLKDAQWVWRGRKREGRGRRGGRGEEGTTFQG